MPATSATFLAFFVFFLAVAINSTNEANKAGGMRILYYLDIYAAAKTLWKASASSRHKKQAG